MILRLSKSSRGQRTRNWSKSHLPSANRRQLKTRTTLLKEKNVLTLLPRRLQFFVPSLLRGANSSDDTLPKEDFTVRPNNPVILSATSTKSQIRQSISPDFCDNIEGISAPSSQIQHYLHHKAHIPYTLPLQDKEAFSKLTDLVRAISRPLPLTNKPAICLISDCCHGYSKQGERVGCVYEQTQLLAGAI